MLELGSYNCSVFGKFLYCLNVLFLKVFNNKLYCFNEGKFLNYFNVELIKCVCILKNIWI